MSRKNDRNTQRKNKAKISSHKKVGSKLIAPINQISNLSYMSWLNDRLPCMLWAGLLINGIGRARAIEVFRNIGLHVGNQFQLNDNRNCNLPRIGLYGISTLDDDLKDKFFEILMSEDGAIESLKPLLLIEKLPLIEHWKKRLGNALESESTLWIAMAHAVAILLDHQSQFATDCRWAYMIPIVNSGKCHLQNQEQWREFVEYPYYQDQRKVRPFIRSSEIQFGSGVMDDEYSCRKKEWARIFWDECKAKTKCFSPDQEISGADFDVMKTIVAAREIWSDLIIHFGSTDSFTNVQPERDASFGFCFYALTVMQEGLASSGKLLTAKLALRMLAEIYITFKYLVALVTVCLFQLL